MRAAIGAGLTEESIAEAGPGRYAARKRAPAPVDICPAATPAPISRFETCRTPY